MGRTNSTYRNHLDNFKEQFAPFKKGLRKENKKYFSQLWENAFSYAQAAAYMNPKNPGLPAIISMLLGVQKEVKQNSQHIRDLRTKINEEDRLELRIQEEIESGVQSRLHRW